MAFKKGGLLAALLFALAAISAPAGAASDIPWGAGDRLPACWT